MEDPVDNQTKELFNNSEGTFRVAKEVPIIEEENDAIYNKKERMNLNKKIKKTYFFKVKKKKKKRFRITIKCIHVPGNSLNSKINNIYTLLASKAGFLECRPYFDKANKEAWITAIFDSQEAADAATKMQLFDDNEFKLTLLKDRGDIDVQRRTLVVRDLPLDVNRNLLKAILEDKFGKIENLKTRLAGPWFRADVTFESADGIESNLDCWAIQYKKDLCRIAPAYFTRDNIEE